MTLNIGAAVKHLRIAHKITQEQLAEQIGGYPARVSKIENNQREPRLDVLGDIASALGVELSQLIELAEAFGDIGTSESGMPSYRVERKEQELMAVMALFQRLNEAQRKALQLFLLEMLPEQG